MKKITVFVLAAALTPLLGVARPASAQRPDRQQQPGQQAQSAQTFKGQIMHRNGEYVFQDASTTALYRLDNQDKARPFDGKRVQVTGTLDAQNSTIYVSEIRPAAS